MCKRWIVVWVCEFGLALHVAGLHACSGALGLSAVCDCGIS